MGSSNRPEGSRDASARLIQSFTVRWLFLLLGVPDTHAVVRYHVVEGVAWSHYPLYIANKSCLLAAVFFIGTSYLIGKTLRVYDEEPDKRLILIKFCGLVGFSLAAIHALMPMLLFSSIYYPKFFLEAGKMNLTAFSADAPLAIRFLFLGTGSVSTINSANGPDVSEDSQLELPKREEFPHVMETPPLRSGRSAQASPPLSEWRILEQFRMLGYCDSPIPGRV